MILRVQDKKHIPAIVELSEKITDWNFSREELIEYLTLNIKHPALFVLLDEERQSFSISSVFKDWLTPYIVVMLAYADPEYQGSMKEQTQMIEDWAKQNGIGTLKILVKRRLAAFNKKYGYRPEGMLMRKELSREATNG